MSCYWTRRWNDVKEFFVVAEYFEKAIRPVPVSLGAESSNSEGQEYSRIQEGCRIGFMNVDPVSDHNALGPGTPGCGQKHLWLVVSSMVT